MMDTTPADLDIPDAKRDIPAPQARTCYRCDGERSIGSGTDPAPWSFWENLQPGADIAVRLGWVVKVPCTACEGTE